MAESIIASFGLNNSSFKKGIKENDRELGRFDKTVSRVGNNIKAMGAGIALGFAISRIKNLKNELDEIGKAANRIGITTKEIQVLRDAAVKSGSSISGLDSAMERFNNTLGEARLGTGEGRKAFENLGIALTDNEGLARDNMEVMREFADRISEIEDPTLKAAYSNDVFGRSAAFMITMLQNGSAGLDEFQRKLEETGGVMEDEMIKKSEELNDRLDTLEKTAKGKFTSAMLTVLRYYDNIDKQAKDIEKIGFFASKEEIEQQKQLMLAQEKAKEAEKEAIKRNAKLAAAEREKELKETKEREKLDADIAKLNEGIAKRKEKYNKDLAKAEAKLSNLIEKFAFDQMSLTERKIYLEKELAKTREQSGKVGLIGTNARIQELELTKELLKTEEDITREIERREEDKADAEKELADAIKTQKLERITAAKQARDEVDAAIEKAKAEEKSLKALQAQAVARAADAGGRESGKASKVQDLRERAQKLEDQGRFKEAAKVSSKADGLEEEITETRKQRLFEEARKAKKGGDLETFEKLRGQAERAGYIDSAGRDEDRSVSAQTKEATESEAVKLREFAQKQAEELNEIKEEVQALTTALQEALNE